jgi:salicylate hydroxylase
MSQPTIRVAITGGGLAGATLLHALLQHPHLDVHIFESAAAFKEAGMAIGMARNAFQALELIGPSARACLEKAGSVPHHGVKFMLAQGPDAGEMVDEIDAKKDGKRLTSIVHRAEFLKQLLADAPAERMHASKKLRTVDRNPDASLTLRFADGSTHDCDVLMGADGIHSTVRQIILGESDPAAKPVSAGWYHLPSLQPYEKMRAILGDTYVNMDDAREWGWFGDGTFVMHNVLSEGGLVQIIAAVQANDLGDSWQKTVSAAEFKSHFRHWPTHLQDALAAVSTPDAARTQAG